MAEFKVTISDMTEAAGKFNTESENFRSTSAAMLQAANALTETGGGWDDEASKIFAEKIGELDAWVKNMSEIIEEYSKQLNTSADQYTTADQTAAKNFKY